MLDMLERVTLATFIREHFGKQSSKGFDGSFYHLSLWHTVSLAGFPL